MFTNLSRRSLMIASGIATVVLLFGDGFGAIAMAETRPLSTSEQLELTGTQSVEAIRSGRLSAEVYVRTLIARAEQLSKLNSLIFLNKEGAIAAAQKIDALRASGAVLGPLAGLPLVVKDNINTADMPTTGGTPALKGFQPSNNAPALQRLLDSGAIVLGKANLHELAFGGSSTNFSPFAGTVHNPYDFTRVPGGSSGGTGAAVAARIAPVGLGTDTGGSVREPASLCGLAGFRPSVGNGGDERRYDGTGVLPISHTRDTIGPMARTMEDVALLDSVMSRKPMATAVSLSGLRLGVPASFWTGTDNEVNAVMAKAKAKLVDAGVVLVDIDAKGLTELTSKVGFPIALHEAHMDIPPYLAANGTGKITLAEVAAQVASPDVKPIMAAVLAGSSNADYELALKTYRPQLQAVYAHYFVDNRLDAMLYPTMIVAAPLIDSVRGSPKVSINGGALVDFFGVAVRNTDPGSSAGVPGITLPAGLTADGLPVGLGLDGPVGSDSKLVGIGMSIQSLLGPLPAPSL